MPPKVLITASPEGLVAGALSTELQGKAVLSYFTRHPKAVGQYLWNPEEGSLNPEALRGVTHIVHLAGAPINGSRWTPRYRQLILDSRVQLSLIGLPMCKGTKKRRDRSLYAFPVGSEGIEPSTP